MNFHLLYTSQDGKFMNEKKEFADFNAAEEWLESICAKYWEIGIDNKDGGD